MKYWIIVLTPETYETAQKKQLIGVRTNEKKRFTNELADQDCFITYVSRKKVFDGYGKIKGDAFYDETAIFGQNGEFPCRRGVVFHKTGLETPCGELFWGVEPFNQINTSGGNYLLLRGGFVEITKKDYYWLKKEIEK